jgi:chemotaxis protein methyltransferase CheR
MTAKTNLLQQQETVKEFLGYICQAVHKIAGIQLGARQLSMVENRVRKRALELGLVDLAAYQGYFEKNSDSEIQALISLLTTHHTFFFREFEQFDYLAQNVLPELILRARSRSDKKIRVWSAACSRGHEVYSLAMFLKHHLARLAPDLGFEIIGTDIDPQSVSIASNGVYHRRDIKEAPLIFLSNHWARVSGEIEEYVKAKKSIKDHCTFKVVNLFSIPAELKNQKFDFIFCRNVFIYFDVTQIKTITEDLMKALDPDGFLFVALSESLSTVQVNLSVAGPSVYRKTSAVQNKRVDLNNPIAVSPSPPMKKVADLIRVLCVDDSPSIKTILKNILTAENGFEVVATASNGKEATEALKKFSVDVLTLDIHMPEQSGIEYLRGNFGPNHPPVVMVSSVSRDDSALALEALRLGACDFIEKPTLSCMEQKGSELRAKLKSAMNARLTSAHIALEKTFQKPACMIKSDRSWIVLVGNLSQLKKMEQTIQELRGSGASILILFESLTSETFQFVSQKLSARNFKVHQCEEKFPTSKEESIFIGDYAKLIAQVAQADNYLKMSICVFGGISSFSEKLLLKSARGQVLLEDLGIAKGTLIPMNSTSLLEIDTVPFTSFAYMSSLFLAKGNS